jgi:pimeloyl-ACP methyl ester carboxylesterase
VKPRRAAGLVAAAATLVVAAATEVVAQARPERHASAESKPNVLLVHGAFSDGGVWSGVIRRLTHDGYHVIASQIPLTSFADDVAAVQRDLRTLSGPTVVVGHSYGGAVVTQAAERNPQVVAVVYLAAIAPDTGEIPLVINDLAPPLPSGADIVPIDLPNVGENGAPYVIVRRDRFVDDFCQDCRPAEAAVLAAEEIPTNASAFGTPLVGTPAWREVPAWYQISAHDHLINPVAERVMAARMDPSGQHTVTLRTGHAAMLSEPEAVTRFVERAAA